MFLLEFRYGDTYGFFYQVGLLTKRLIFLTFRSPTNNGDRFIKS